MNLDNNHTIFLEFENTHTLNCIIIPRLNLTIIK